MDELYIHKSEEDVFKAKDFLLEISQTKQLDTYTAKVKVDPKYHRYLIGRNGVIIKKVEDKTGTRIGFPRKKDKNCDVVHITGQKEEVKAAKRALEGMIDDLETISTTECEIPQEYYGAVLGAQGSNIQIIEKYFEVSVRFPKSKKRYDSNRHNIITIKGKKENCDKACQALLDLVPTTEVIEIPYYFHNFIIGKKGSNKKSVEEIYNVVLIIPPQSDHSNFIIIKGSPANIEEAKVVLKEKIQQLKFRREDKVVIEDKDLILTEVVEVPCDLHRFIIGKKGNNVTSMKEFYNVDIFIPPQSAHSDFITIQGAAENVEKAKLALNERVEQLELEKQDKLLRSFKLSFEVDPQYRPKIIGRNGARITKIREENDVQIKIPDQNTNQRLIIITGYEKNAEAAKEAILKLIPEQKSKEFNESSYSEGTRIHSRDHIHLGDNEEEEEKDLQRDMKFEKMTKEKEEEHSKFDDNKKELRNEEFEEILADKDRGSLIFNNTQLTTSTIVFKCSCIRIGSYKISPMQHDRNIDVILTEKSIKFIAPSLLLNEKRYFVINLRDCDIIKMWIHFGKRLPVIFVYTSKQFGELAKSHLNLKKGNTVLFDPTSDDMEKNKIIFVIDSLSEELHTFMRRIFPGPKKLKEIDKKEANEILLKSMPTIQEEKNEVNDNVNHLSVEDKIMIRSMTEEKLRDLKSIFLQANRFKKRNI